MRILKYITGKQLQQVKKIKFSCTRQRSTIEQQECRSLVMATRNDMFTDERSRLLHINAPTIEKIKVNYKAPHLGKDIEMLMNKHLSTPHDCSMHISGTVADESVLALVIPTGSDYNINQDINDITLDKNEQMPCHLWDMHRPLTEDCDVHLLKFDMRLSPSWLTREVNKAYWRSCSMLLGALSQKAFDDGVYVSTLRFPDTSVESGAFCCDIKLDSRQQSWKVDESVLISLTKAVRAIISNDHIFERLEVKKAFALDLFQSDPDICSRITSDRVVLYRLGDYIDVIDGPMISNTSLMYQFVTTAVHQLNDNIWRMQGLSLPKKLELHHAAWATLEQRATRLVRENLPVELSSTINHKPSTYTYKSIENQTKIYNINTGQWLQDGWKSEDTKIQTPV